MSSSRAAHDSPVSASQQFHDSLFRSLLEISRRYQALMMNVLQQKYGHSELTLAFEGVMRSVPREGIRHGDLADRLGRKKQNIGAVLRAVEAAGYIRIAPDSEDKRAKRVLLTDRGRQLIAEAIEVTDRINAGVVDILGEDAFCSLKQTLTRLRIGLTASEAAVDIDTPGAFIEYLIQVSDASSARLYRDLHEQGFADIRPSHSNIILYFGEQSQQVGHIARAQAVSRQAIGRVVAELEQNAYLVTLPDPADKRGKVIRLAPRGQAFMVAALSAADRLLEDFGKMLGKDVLQAFGGTLAELHAGFYRIETAVLPQAGSGRDQSDDLACQQVLEKLERLESQPNGQFRGLLVRQSVESGEQLVVDPAFLDKLARFTLSR